MSSPNLGEDILTVGLTASFSVPSNDVIDLLFYIVHNHHKRLVDWELKYETVHAPNVIVYVDENGEPFSTSYGDESPRTREPDRYYTDMPAAPTPEPVADFVPEEEPKQEEEPLEDDFIDFDPYAYDFGSPPVEQDSADDGYSESGQTEEYDFSNPAVSTFGLTYAPYGESGCKTKEEIRQEFESVDEYGSLRIYGTDCDQVSNIIDLAEERGMKVFLGVFDINNIEEETQAIIDGASSCWECVHTVSIGNELINSGEKSVDEVLAAMKTAGNMLRDAGYNGAIVTVDTAPAMIDHPALCEASDYPAVNLHAFFDGNVEASGAGQFVLEQSERVKKACGGKDPTITESGWPHQGETNGKAVPSRKNQQVAIQSLRDAFKDKPDRLYIFTLDDTPWKVDNEYTFGAEKFWGIRA